MVGLASAAHAQRRSLHNSTDRSVKLISNFSVDQIFQDIQIHSISRDQRGLVYFGFSKGIAEFDGVEWRKIEVPGEAPIYALTINKDGRIYGGGKNELGYLLVDAKGNTKFKSLLEGSHKDFNDTIVNIASFGSKIYFVGLKSISLFQNEKLSFISSGATDRVDNREKAKELTLVVDNTPPKIILNFSSSKIGSSTSKDGSVLDQYPVNTVMYLAATEEKFIVPDVRSNTTRNRAQF